MIVIHCSATPNGRAVTAEEIDRWHKARGFRRDSLKSLLQEPALKHIGYHFVIYTDGLVRSGRSEAEVGAHVSGHNSRSIGICLAGMDRYSEKQWLALRGLVVSLQKKYPRAVIKGHRDLSPDRDGDGTVGPHEWLKTCPGFDVVRWLANQKQPLPAHVLEAV